MTTIVVTPTAKRHFEVLIDTRSLPPATRERVKTSLEPLRQSPLLGATLDGRWSEFRFLLGPWRWMLVIYRYDEALDRAAIVTIRDARSARSPRP